MPVCVCIYAGFAVTDATSWRGVEGSSTDDIGELAIKSQVWRCAIAVSKRGWSCNSSSDERRDGDVWPQLHSNRFSRYVENDTLSERRLKLEL